MYSSPPATQWQCTGIILCKCPTNERWRYNVTSSLIGWAHTQNNPWVCKPTVYPVIRDHLHHQARSVHIYHWLNHIHCTDYRHKLKVCFALELLHCIKRDQIGILVVISQSLCMKVKRLYYYIRSRSNLCVDVHCYQGMWCMPLWQAREQG